jgi:nicotinate-nucleotide adenylyltransferase
MSSVYPLTTWNRQRCDITEPHENKVGRVGIIGGSFDPPSMVHMIIGSELLNLEQVDEVWYVPCGEREDRKLTEGKIRLEMLAAAVDAFFWGNREQVKILDIELKNKEMMQTYDLLVELRS